jgi:hypothetical protein
VELETTGVREPLGGENPLVAPVDDPGTVACRCGEEPIDTSFGQHVVGPKCRAQIARDVRHRFGAQRYGGRLYQFVEDVVQECYEKLVRPGGLDSFRPPPDRPPASAFRAWLAGVVRNHCNNKQKYWQVRPDLEGIKLDQLGDPMHAETPAQALALQSLRELKDGAVADVEPRWREKGAKWSERFDVFLPFVLEQDDDYERAQERLGISALNARQLKFKLAGEIGLAARSRVRDELFLEPGLSSAEVDARIDQAIDELFRDAFPEREDWQLGFLSGKPESELKPERDEVPPESET